MDHTKKLIVVGVDGSPEGDAALRFAFDEATRTGEAIEVITAWNIEVIPVSPYIPLGDLPSSAQLEQAARRRQEAALARVLGDSPSVTVSSQVLCGDARTLLVEAALRARLLVVGSRPMGPFRAVLLGSVSRYCAHHSACPVVVVPSSESRPTPAAEVDVTAQV